MVSRFLLDPNDARIAGLARKLAGNTLAPDDVLLDVMMGNLRRFWDNGVDEPVVTPKRWMRTLPITRGLTIVTYTRAQVLFLADGFGRNCALTMMHRIEERDGNQLVFIFSRPQTSLSILQLEVIGSRDGWPARLLAARDEERKKFNLDIQERLNRLDQMIQGRSVDEICRSW